MTRDIAHVQLTGRIGNTPELKYLPSGDPVTTFGVAVNRGAKEEESTDWYRVTCYGRTAEFATGYLAKGRKVLVIGRQEIRQWEGRDGAKRKEVEVRASELIPIDSRPAAKAAEEGAEGQETDAPAFYSGGQSH